ncbi:MULTISPECIES: type IV secretory system conjugative DNA transfer family protein [unclassified Spirillospora]|uniref:type IV secretory system conjugative DNA transfer family protein n=1 Tax=unclassified Spirillospora TaxID=2642701 RepID=UPI003720C719
MSSSDDDEVYGCLIGLGVVTFLLGGATSFLVWLAGQLSGLLTGRGWPDSSPGDALRITYNLVRSPGDPQSAWPPVAAAAIGSSPLFFFLLIVLLALASVVVYFVVRLLLNVRRHRPIRRLRLGYASGWEVRKLLSARTALSKAHQVRPSTATRSPREVKPEDVGFYLGRDVRSRRKLYASIEDTAIIVSAPRQGKDVHFVTPFTIDAPGPCIVTSTRRETFVNTAMARAQFGEVYVFDPFNWTGWPNRMRWSPLQGCEDPNVCAVRSATLVQSSHFSIADEGTHLTGVLTIIRCLLHAGAIGKVNFRRVMDWVHDANPDEAIEILRTNAKAAPGYAAQLEFQRSSRRSWTTVIQVMHCFSHPNVLEDCSPPLGEEFDFIKFLKGRNTLYFVGKQQPDWGGIAPVVTTIIEQYFRSARGTAMKNPTGRLDPPLTFELNQVTDICPIGGLPVYMGESGGYSITVHVYLTSLADARARWGGDGAARLWENSSIKIVSGGTGTAKDLDELSSLVGKDHGQQVLRPEELRTMPFGRAVVVAGTARPVEMWLTPWWKRKDGDFIAQGKKTVEQMIERSVAQQAAGTGPAPDPITAEERDSRPRS